MADFNIKSDSVDVEQIMRQIRERIRDKRGVDYTDQEIRELATAKLDRFLDPTGIRSDLLAYFRSQKTPPLYAFEDTTLFESDKAIVRFFRRLLRPVLKLFFSSNVLTTVLHQQAAINQHLMQLQPLYYEVIHNLVVELTRVSVETKNMKMRLESLQGRLEFNERRARALEAVVQYKGDALAGGRDEEPAGTEPQGGIDPITGGESLRTRRRRRRRSRRPQGQPGAAGMAGEEAEDEPGAEQEGPDVSGEPSERAPRVQVTPHHISVTGRHGTAEQANSSDATRSDTASVTAETGSRTGRREGGDAEAGQHEPAASRVGQHEEVSGPRHEQQPGSGGYSPGEQSRTGEPAGDRGPDTPRDSEPQ